jgi:hypothetical protein
VGFLLAPLLPVILLNLVWIVMLVTGTGNTATSAFVLVLSTLLSYGLAVLFGAPAIWFLKLFNRVSIVSISACGLFLGPLAWMVMQLAVQRLLSGGWEIDVSLVGLFIGALVGFGTALLFSLIAGISNTSIAKNRPLPSKH